MSWAIILHGGAKEIDPEDVDAHRVGCLRALEAGRRVLAGDGSAVDAVEAAIRVLEADPTFNAGFGSALNADGAVEMCASIMEGSGFNVGGVAVIRGVQHPISVARALLFKEEILLAGDGARRFAAENDCELCHFAALVPRSTGRKPVHLHDTVGCVALDAAGLMAVGTSAGGLDGAATGRVGDSPMPGCGFYVDDTVGGVAFSGDGEQIARRMLAAGVLHRMPNASPDAALQSALHDVARIGGSAGGIVLTPAGAFGWQHNSRDFAVAYQSSRMAEPACFANKAQAGH